MNTKRLSSPVLPCTLFVILLTFNLWQTLSNPTRMRKETLADFNHDFRPCAAIGPRTPQWADRAQMQRQLPLFSKVYEKRLVRNNAGGMRYDHSFALWYTLRNLRPVPKVVVESGAHRGHSAWLIKQALPAVKIISISPTNPMLKFPGIEYMTGNKFKDFGKIAWNETGIDLANALALFDDHQSADIRIIDQGRKAGFRRFVYDDNYPYLDSDNLSMKWLCETEGKESWPGVIKRNFGKTNETQTWDEHMRQAKKLKGQVKYYVEFPPIQKARKYSSAPLVEDIDLFEKLVGPISKEHVQFVKYGYICYVETF